MIRRCKAAAIVSATLLAFAGVAKVTLGKVGSYRANHVAPRESPMLRRIVMAAVLTGLLAAGGTSGARAQQPTSSGQQTPDASGWIFNVAPYLWTATMEPTVKLNLPPALGGTVSASSSIDFDALLQHLNFATMVTADAQYDRFSLLTDFIYLNLGGAGTKLRSLNFPGHPSVPITADAQAHAGLNLNGKTWTMAGGYTLLKGDWGNVDVIAGFRYFGMPIAVDYSLGVTLTGPRGNGATFGGQGSVSGTASLWNGIGGFRGRIRIGDTGLFIPYYFDAGAGSSQLTWQIASGLGYHTNWVDVSLTYRYLTFEQNGNAVLQRLTMYGPQFMATFTF